MQKLKITNLPPWISELHLKQYFNPCGKIVHASIARDNNTMRPIGHGFLIFADETATKNALLKDGMLLDGMRIAVEIFDEVPMSQEV
jgi:RNA recognition motif-containing protein